MKKRLTLLLALMSGLAAHAYANLKVELVNSTGKSADDIEILMVGNSGTITKDNGKLTVATASNSVDSVKLSSLPTGTAIVSPYTNENADVYTFEIETLESGKLYFFYGPSDDLPYSYAGGTAPSPATSTLRFDYAELSFAPNQQSVCNLSSIDQFAIPLQMDLYDQNSNHLLRRNMYTSTQSVIDIFSDKTLGDAIFGLKDGAVTKFSDTSGEIGDFLRILGYNQMTKKNAGDSPAPYSSFSHYLEAISDLSAAKNSFTIKGVAAGENYDYTAVLSSTGSGSTEDYTFTLTKNNGSYAPLGNTITVDLSHTQYNFLISSAPLGQSGWISIDGTDITNTSGTNQTIYQAVVRDLTAALNLGYVDGRYGQSTDQWYSQAIPKNNFGAARTTNDGFYNPWAAMIYNHSEAYSFSFSDKIVPSPAINAQDGYTLRLTILPDLRLDAPDVHVSSKLDGETMTATLSWEANTQNEPGLDATGYAIEWVANGATPTTMSGKGTGIITHEITGLDPQLTYEYKVYTTGTLNSKSVRSAYDTVRVHSLKEMPTPPFPAQGSTFAVPIVEVTFNNAQPNQIAKVVINDQVMTLDSSNQTWGQTKFPGKAASGNIPQPAIIPLLEAFDAAEGSVNENEEVFSVRVYAAEGQGVDTTKPFFTGQVRFASSGNTGAYSLNDFQFPLLGLEANENLVLQPGTSTPVTPFVPLLPVTIPQNSTGPFSGETLTGAAANNPPYFTGSPAVFQITFIPLGERETEDVIILSSTGAGTAKSLGNNFYESPIFGIFWSDTSITENYIYSTSYDWVYLSPENDPENLWFWPSIFESWHWANEEIPGWVYSNELSTWLYTDLRDGGVWVYNSNIGTWTFVPIAGDSD